MKVESKGHHDTEQHALRWPLSVAKGHARRAAQVPQLIS